MRRRLRRCTLVLFGLWAGWGAPAAAELVVLSGGYVLKVARFEVEDEVIHLDLPSGGRLTLPLVRVERIVEDEIVPVGQIEDPPFELGFRDGQAIPETPYGELIFEASRQRRLNPELVAAMARWESAFDAGAVSPKGAAGLLQLMPATALRFGISPPERLDPVKNLDAATRYLEWLVERFEGDLPLVLAAYNAGEANVERYQGVPPFRETRDYIERIYGTLGLASYASAER